MPDVQGSIAEIDRALALPGAAGVVLLTSYDGQYLGDPKFDALMDHLERRKCVTFAHPTTAPCCIGLTPFVFTPLIPWAPVDNSLANLDRLNLDPALLQQIRHGNAQRLLGRFA